MVPPTPSNLSNPRYGYDFVVATTQASIDATLKQFLSELTEPEVVVCYVADIYGRPDPIDYHQLLKNADADPFNILDGADPNTNADLQRLRTARFMVAFRARLGIPKVKDPRTLPPVVILGNDTNSVTFNLMCEEFDVVELNPGGYTAATWMHQSQKADTPWLFQSKVNLSQQIVDPSTYHNLPSAVKTQVDALNNISGTAFSVQQLLFDLTHANLMTVPTISGVTPGTTLYMILQQYFLGAYFTQMQKDGQPLIGCSIVKQDPDPSTLELASFDMQVDPYVDLSGNPYPRPTLDEQQVGTLDYLCTVKGKQQQKPCNFDWNWVDVSEISQYDGIVSINRNTFTTWLDHQLTKANIVPPNCISCSAECYRDGLIPHYNWGFTANQVPTKTFPATGQVVLQYSYNCDANDEASWNVGALHLWTDYKLTVECINNTIVITQHLTMYVYIRADSTSRDGKVIDKIIRDTYSLAIDGSGGLSMSTPSRDNGTSVLTDYSDPPGNVNPALNFFVSLNGIVNDAVSAIRSFDKTTMKEPIPASMQGFVFPGGKTFAFKSVNFSTNQDLVCHIKYTDSLKQKVEVVQVLHPRVLSRVLT